MQDLLSDAAMALSSLVAAGGVAFAEESAKNLASDAHALGGRLFRRARVPLDQRALDSSSIEAALKAALDAGEISRKELEDFVFAARSDSTQIQNNIETVTSDKAVIGSTLQARKIIL